MTDRRILVELEGRPRLSRDLFSIKQVETSIIPRDEAENILKSFNDKAREEGPNRAITIFLSSMILVCFFGFGICGYLVVSSHGNSTYNETTRSYETSGQLPAFLPFIPFVGFALFGIATTVYYRSKIEKMTAALTEHAFEVSSYYKQHGFQVIFERIIESVTITVRRGHGVSSSNNYIYRVLMFKIEDAPPPFQAAVMQPTTVQYYMQPAPTPSSSKQHDEMVVARLVLKGFSRDRVLQALDIAGGNEQKAESVLRQL